MKMERVNVRKSIYQLIGPNELGQLGDVCDMCDSSNEFTVVNCKEKHKLFKRLSRIHFGQSRDSCLTDVSRVLGD